MNNYNITKAVINSAVTRGIREIEADPERGLRRLADLGRQFSNTPFQEYIFSVIQELLAKENSCYYDLIATVLNNCDHETIKTLGINQGYMSWIYGGKLLRNAETASGHAYPLTIFLRYDPTRKDGLTLEQIASIIEQGKTLGVYSYYIRQTDSPFENYELPELFGQNQDCFFLWIRSTGRLTAAHVEILKDCKNAVVVLPMHDAETHITAGLLKDEKVAFSLYAIYSDEDILQNRLTRYLSACFTAESPFCLLIAADENTLSAGKWCFDSRLNQEYPVCITDYYADAIGLTKHVCGHNALLEIGENGTILKPEAFAGQKLDPNQPLQALIAKYMPPLDSVDVPSQRIK